MAFPEISRRVIVDRSPIGADDQRAEGMLSKNLTWVICGVAATLVGTAAAAFDGFSEMVAGLPIDSADARAEFYFMSPRLVLDWPPRDIPGIGLSEITPVLVDAALGVEKVGISFPDLAGIVHLGSSPHRTIHLFGPELNIESVAEALLRRPDMEQLERNGVTVFAEGADNETNLNAVDRVYPFGGGWRAHRVAVWDGGALVAFNWADLEHLLAARGAEVDAGRQGWHLVDLVSVAANATPGGAEVFAAAGFPIRVFQLEGAPQPIARSVQAFSYVLFVAITDGNDEAVQMVLVYDDRTAAEASTKVLASRLSEINGPDGTVVTRDIAELPGGAFGAVITLAFTPDAEDHPASRELRRWLNDVLSGRLQILSVAE